MKEGIPKKGEKAWEKICIVKLRKHLTNPVNANTDRLWGSQAGPKGPSLFDAMDRCRSDAHAGIPESHDGTGEAEKSVSLPLTRDQVRTLQSHTCMASLWSGSGVETGAFIRQGGDPIIIKLELPVLPAVRLLKLDEVTLMLRISRSYLHRILSEGALKSYKLGRLRRIMLDDVLSYLEAHEESAPSKRILKRSSLKEG